jgi:hypothetical protein
MRGGAVALLVPLLLCGCVERWILVRSDPPDAEVLIDGTPAGRTPLKVKFDYYGDREIVLRKPRFQTHRAVEPVSAPWWQYFPFEFFTDVVLPFRFEDGREFDYVLRPQGEPEEADRVRDRAAELKEKLDRKE